MFRIAYTPRSEASARGANGELERQATNAAQLKRSKSLMQRIKKGVKSPNLPMEMPPSPISGDPNEYEELRSDPPSTSQLPPSSPIGRKASLLHKFGLVKRSNTRFWSFSLSSPPLSIPPLPLLPNPFLPVLILPSSSFSPWSSRFYVSQ
jgi:hypothetical protein